MKKLLAPFLERSQLFGFKDPRTARLLPLWNQVFAELELQPRFVICIRDPAHVGVSLHTRDGLDHETGEQRALDYMVDALRYTRRYDRCFIRYEDWLRDPSYNAKRLWEFVGANSPIDLQDLEIAAQSVFREELSRSGQSAPKARQPLIRSFFGLVERFAERNGTEPDLDDRIDDFVHHYVAFRQLLRPFEEQVTAAVGARVSLEGRLAAVQASFEAERATSSGLNDAHANAQARAEAAERSAESLTADIARLKEYILRLEEAQQVAAGHAARIGDLTTALAAAEAERDRVGSDAMAAAAQAQQTAAGQAARLEDLAAALALAEAERQRFASEAKAAEDQARNAAAGHAARIEDLTAALAAAKADRERVISEAGATAEQARRMLAEQAARIEDLSTAAAALAQRSNDHERYRVWTRLFGHA